jgi:hypothetical protein
VKGLETRLKTERWFFGVAVLRVFLFVFASASCALTQNTFQQAATINQMVGSYISDHHVPGLSLAVIDRGHVVFTQGYGLADVENNVPANADTVYRIASLSKPITAVAAMCGDQQGVSSVLYLLPARQFGVVVLSNLQGQQSSLDFIGLSRKIYDVVSRSSGNQPD